MISPLMNLQQRRRLTRNPSRMNSTLMDHQESFIWGGLGQNGDASG